MRISASILFLALSASSSSGSSRVVEISKSSQSESPIEFLVVGTPGCHQGETVSVELTLPSGQKELAHLWSMDLWVQQDDKTVLAMPIEQDNAEDDTVTVRFYGNADAVRQCLIAIRCGEHAPLSETIFQIDVGSYIDSEPNHSPIDAGTNPWLLSTRIHCRVINQGTRQPHRSCRRRVAY